MNGIAFLFFVSNFVHGNSFPGNNGRIVGGEDIPIEKVPYQISLQYDGKHGCGGSIIAPNYIVTAAHCAQFSSEDDLSVRAGTSTRESGGQVVDVKKINMHPNFDGLDYDIAILELADDLVYGDKIAPIGLPDLNESWPGGTEVLVTGWGVLHFMDTTIPINLQGVTVELMDQETCMSDFGVTERMLCAGVDEGGKDACTEDSGGPLEVDGTLLGIVSFGSGCAQPKKPGIYANVPALRGFIQDIAGL